MREYPDTVYLNVSSCDEGVESLARCARLCPGARVVYAQDWGDFEGGEELFDSPHASLIVSLLLAEVFLEGSDEMEPLVYGLRKSALRFLSLEECSLGAECLDALAQIEALHTLQGLALRDNRITQEGLSFLLASPHLANVTRLDMGGRYLGNELGDEGAVMLCHAPELAGLTYLDLGSNSIGSRGLRALTESDVLSGLEYLNLSRNKFSREDWACLHSATFNASMRYLVLPYCFEDEESMAEFERMYRSCSSAQVVWFE